MRGLLSAVFVGVVSLGAPSDAAIVFFADDFNRTNSNEVGNGWTELEDDANDVRIHNNTLRLRDNISHLPDAAAATMTIDPSGYTGLVAHFRWRGFQWNEHAAKLFLSYAVDPAPSLLAEKKWTTVFTGSTDGGVWNDASIALDPGVEDANFNLMFWTKVSAANEGFIIDDLKVTGSERSLAVVPLPATLPLLGLGVVCAAAFGSRRRTARS